MVGLQHKDDLFCTPPWLFRDIVRETKLWFTLDICASEENSLCDSYINEEMDLLKRTYINFIDAPKDEAYFCNPPRSKNGKFVNFVHDELWKNGEFDVVMLLCWNDIGNKYGEKLLPLILSGDIEVHNLGKVKFYKDGRESEYVSRLCYFWAWFKKK